MSTPTPFTIAIPDSELQSLKQKLDSTRYPQEIEDTGSAYGAPVPDVKRIATYWKDTYDWRKAEAKLNKLPNYMTKIGADGFDPIDIHFIHQKSKNENAIPLIFVHGWPGSFLEVTKILPILADSEKNGGPAFHVVAPSLPNFGFSGFVNKKGFGQKQYTETCHKLMLSLGYDKYVTQGGDWGALITRTMGKLYPTHIPASHINMIATLPPPWWNIFAWAKFLIAIALNLLPASEKAGLERTQWTQRETSGYRQLQMTKPQTVGFSLADSPVGLLAWVYEKLVSWTDDYAWTDDEVCTWMSIYWFSTAGPAASVNIYYESERGEFVAFDMNNRAANRHSPHLKLGFSIFPKELVLLPRAWGRSLGNVVFEREHERGGHFAAYENPEALAGDLMVMFGKGGAAGGAVEGKSGYA